MGGFILRLEKRYRHYTIGGISLAIPMFLLYGLVIFYPIFSLLFTSFFEWNGIQQVAPRFVGIENYINFFKMKEAPIAFGNVFLLLLVGVCGTLPIAFFLATVVNKKFRALRLFKTCYFLPVVINSVATCLMFTFLLYPKLGPVPVALRALGIDGGNNILGNVKTAIWAVAFVNMWCFTGFQMIVFSAGMAAIPQEIYEAAELDGVTSWQKLRFITIPMLRSTIKIVLVFVMTGAFKVFDIVMALTAGGPSGATEVLNTLVYKTAFNYSRFGQADAIAVIMLILCLSISLGVNRIFREHD